MKDAIDCRVGNGLPHDRGLLVRLHIVTRRRRDPHDPGDFISLLFQRMRDRDSPPSKVSSRFRLDLERFFFCQQLQINKFPIIIQNILKNRIIYGS